MPDTVASPGSAAGDPADTPAGALDMQTTSPAASVPAQRDVEADEAPPVGWTPSVAEGITKFHTPGWVSGDFDGVAPVRPHAEAAVPHQTRPEPERPIAPAAYTWVAPHRDRIWAGVLLVACAMVTVLCVALAVERSSVVLFVVSALPLLACVGLWYLLATSTTQVVYLKGSRLTVQQHGSAWTFDLLDPTEMIERGSDGIRLLTPRGTWVTVARDSVDWPEFSTRIDGLLRAADRAREERARRFSL